MIKAGFDLLCADTSTDIVVLAGDTTRDGELASHAEFIEMLRDLKKRGKRVYVITATHDYRDGGVADGYDGDKRFRCRRWRSATICGRCTMSSAPTRPLLPTRTA